MMRPGLFLVQDKEELGEQIQEHIYIYIYIKYGITYKVCVVVPANG